MDERVIVLGENIRDNFRGETGGLFAKYGPERIIDTPISEAACAGLATGAALAGLRPVVEFQVSSLVYLAWDQIANQAAKLALMSGGQSHVPVTYLVMASGARGNNGGQHSDNPYAIFLQAGLKVVIPVTPFDAKGLTTAAIRDDDPVALIYPVALLGTRGEVPEAHYVLPLGRGEVRREGRDVTVIAVGHLVKDALEVATELEPSGIDVHVWDPLTLAPLDCDGLIAAVRKTGRVVIFDDSNRTCGFGAELSAVISDLAFEDLTAPVKRVTRATIAVPFSPTLEPEVLPSRRALAAAIMGLCAPRAAFAGGGQP